MRTAQLLMLICLAPLADLAAQTPVTAPLGAMPSQAQFPRAEFVFEERVTLAPVVVLGKTLYGNRQYIPITGGTIAGPKLNGKVLPGGWDFQLMLADGCVSLSADYFLQADDGTVIHILNTSFDCRNAAGAEGARSYFHPTFEAPLGKYEWLNHGTFVAELSIEGMPAGAPGTPMGVDNAPSQAAQGSPVIGAVRIKFFQIK